MELLRLLLLLPSSSSLLPSFPVLGFDGSPGMDLPLVSVSLPSVPPSNWLPSFFRDAELALPLFSCLFYWPCHRRYARRSGEGTHDGGREGGGRDPPTHALFTDIWSCCCCCCCCCNRRSADLLPPPLKSRIRKRRKSDAPPESLLGPPSPPRGRIERLLSWMHCRACQVVMDDAGSPKDKRCLQVRRRRSRRIAAAIKLLLGETRRSSSRRGRW